MGTLLSCLSGEHPYPEEIENTGRRDKTTNTRPQQQQRETRNYRNNNNLKNKAIKEEFYVPSSIVGLLIGKGGENITRLEEETKCNISIEKSNKDQPTRLCTLIGLPGQVQAAKQQIDKIIKQKHYNFSASSSKVPSKVQDHRGQSRNTPSAPKGSSPGRKPPVKGETKPSREKSTKKGLRAIVIDGSNIAYSHGKSTKFSVKGIEIVVEYFENRGHQTIVAFLPQYRLGSDPAERAVLKSLEQKGRVVFTPSRKVGKEAISSYDDRFILDFATEKQGIVVSRDNYRDIYEDSEQHRETIEKRILMPTFVGDTLMFPDDPLGRNGPRLEEFLKF